MHVCTGLRTMILGDEHANGKRELGGRARTAKVPACDLRPYTGLFSSTSGHMNSRFAGNHT